MDERNTGSFHLTGAGQSGGVSAQPSCALGTCKFTTTCREAGECRHDDDALTEGSCKPLTVGEQAKRVGAWETPEGFVCFGSWMAVAAFYTHAQPDAYAKSLAIRTRDGWTLSGRAVPIYYTDSINGEQVCRDDLWIATTEALATQAELDARAAMKARQA